MEFSISIRSREGWYMINNLLIQWRIVCVWVAGFCNGIESLPSGISFWYNINPAYLAEVFLDFLHGLRPTLGVNIWNYGWVHLILLSFILFENIVNVHLPYIFILCNAGDYFLMLGILDSKILTLFRSCKYFTTISVWPLSSFPSVMCRNLYKFATKFSYRSWISSMEWIPSLQQWIETLFN